MRSRRARHWHMGILILIYTCIQVYSQKANKSLIESTLHGDATTKTVISPTFLSDVEELTAKSIEYDEVTSISPTYRPFPTWRPKRSNCTPPAIEQFPRPLMRPYVRKNGGLIIHFIVAIFTFLGLAIVCRDYFVSSLDRICEELKLSPDVAGATFMAVGSSAPELATVIIGVFFAKDDIGIGGVIGSAVFNMMLVISVCALCSGTVCQLNWWPLVRDCFFYCLSILVMLIIIFNDIISWMESVVMLLFYVVYCVTLHFNRPLEKWALSLNLLIKLPMKEQSALVTYEHLSDASIQGGTQTVTSLSQEPQTKQEQLPTGQQPDYQDYADSNNGWDPNVARGDSAQPVQSTVPPAAVDDHIEQKTTLPQQEAAGTKPEVGQVTSQPEYYKSRERKSLKKPIDGGIFAQISWGVVYPIHYMCRLTMPDCNTEKYRNWYPFTFLISIIWICFYSYFMVWMITIIGSTLGIPDTVMGVTFIAAGVSVPDALNSIAVIKEGYGDMAVSNAIGSNVFDILVCLGLPWFIQTAIIVPGSHVNVVSKGFAYSTLSLLFTVVFLLVSTHLNGWKLDKRLGIILMIWYFSFITLASLYELNVFGELNPPECPSLY